MHYLESIKQNAVIKQLLKIRYISLIAVFFTLLNSLVFMAAGVYESVKGYKMFLEHGVSDEHRPGVYVLKGLDLFLVSMVFMIFGLGILRIFTHHKQDEQDLPGWLKIDNFKQLKVLLWETIIVTMVVFCFTEMATSRTALTLNSLFMPGVILLLTIALALMKRQDKH